MQRKHIFIAALCLSVVVAFFMDIAFHSYVIDHIPDKSKYAEGNKEIPRIPLSFLIGNFIVLYRAVGHWLHASHVAILSAFTIGLFVVTGLLAVYTYRLWSAGEKNARIQLRAYVALDDIYFRWIASNTDPADRRQIQPGHPPRPRIRVKNFGHTPATNMTVRINGLMTAMDAAFEKVYEGREYSVPRQMLAPTQKYGVWTHLHGGMEFDPHRFYDPELFLLVVHGAITYADIYHRWWVTRFCYCYDGANRFLPYTHYNYEQEYKSEKEALDSLSYV
jgi:hypothetical protein